MGLQVRYIQKTENEEVFEITERLALTEDGRVVPEGSAEARWLYAVPGKRIPKAEAIRRGLIAEVGDEEPKPGRKGKNR